ncbi:hypothetical protein [Acidisoma sp. C75]
MAAFAGAMAAMFTAYLTALGAEQDRSGTPGAAGIFPKSREAHTKPA